MSRDRALRAANHGRHERRPLRLTLRGERVAAWSFVITLLALMALVGKIEGIG